MGMRRLVPHADGSSRPDEAAGSIRQQNLTFDEHPEEVGQVEVMQEDDDNARALVGLADVDLSEAKHFRQFTAFKFKVQVNPADHPQLQVRARRCTSNSLELVKV